MFNCNYLNTIWIFLCDHCLVLFGFVFISIILTYLENSFLCIWLFSDVQFIVVQTFSIFPHTETASMPSYSSSSASFFSFLFFMMVFSSARCFEEFFNICSFLYTEFLDNECHVFFAWQTHFFPLPKWIMNGKGINCNRQMFCMDLWKAFTTGIVSAIEIEWNIVDLAYLSTNSKWNFNENNSLVKLIEHEFIYLTWSSAIKFQYRFIFRPITIQRSELTTAITK